MSLISAPRLYNKGKSQLRISQNLLEFSIEPIRGEQVKGWTGDVPELQRCRDNLKYLHTDSLPAAVLDIQLLEMQGKTKEAKSLFDIIIKRFHPNNSESKKKAPPYRLLDSDFVSSLSFQ